MPTIVQLELAKWMSRNLSDHDAAASMAHTTRCIVVDLDASIVLAAGLSVDKKLAMADAIIYATALNVGADLLTCDAHVENLPRVLYLPKTEA